MPPSSIPQTWYACLVTLPHLGITGSRYNPLAQAPYLTAPFSPSDPAGIAALNAEATLQASMVAYINDFALMMIMALGSCVLLLLVHPPRTATKPAIGTG
jgi:MFS transporter, DHA2 family, multidrug resistance protein